MSGQELSLLAHVEVDVDALEDHTLYIDMTESTVNTMA